MERDKAMRKRTKELFMHGFSISKISKVLGKPYQTVKRWVEQGTAGKRGRPKTEPFPEELKKKLLPLLLSVKEEKGKSRVLSLRRIYSLLEIDLKLAGVKTLHAFYYRVEKLVKEEFGSWEALEQKRRPRKEISQFTTPKGKLVREKGVVEIDATGYSFKGKNYSILLVMEQFSSRILGYAVIENKEAGATHYNKAFTSLDVARLLIDTFSHYGLPVAVKTDNEKILTAELIKEGLKTLRVEIKRAKPYKPNQKLIERVIRELKDTMRWIKAESIDELITSAIRTYNSTLHKFEHFAQPVSPDDVFPHEAFREASEDELRSAFRERFVRSVHNNTIRIDNLVYEFVLTQEEKELGRSKKSAKVLCYRDIQDLTKLYVYDNETGEYLGVAPLLSQTEHLEPTEHRRAKQEEKRREERVKKLKEEVRKYEEASVSKEEEDILQLLAEEQTQEMKGTEGEEEIDILKLLSQED